VLIVNPPVSATTYLLYINSLFQAVSIYVMAIYYGECFGRGGGGLLSSYASFLGQSKKDDESLLPVTHSLANHPNEETHSTLSASPNGSLYVFSEYCKHLSFAQSQSIPFLTTLTFLSHLTPTSSIPHHISTLLLTSSLAHSYSLLLSFSRR